MFLCVFLAGRALALSPLGSFWAPLGLLGCPWAPFDDPLGALGRPLAQANLVLLNKIMTLYETHWFYMLKQLLSVNSKSFAE